MGQGDGRGNGGRPAAAHEDRAATYGFQDLTVVERFDQLVRTVRFIEAGREAVSRRTRG